MTIEFTVPGIPRPQGSKRIGRAGRTGRPIIVDDNPKPLRDWRTRIVEHARQAAAGEILDGPVAVIARFTFTLPASRIQKRSAPPRHVAVRPDLDKCTRAVLDALVDAGVLRDDAQVAVLAASKTYGDHPGVAIEIRPLTDRLDLAAEPDQLTLLAGLS
jgi:Holliday junction resolvase RusA-like endonuclease